MEVIHSGWKFSYRKPGLTMYHRAGMAGLALSLKNLQARGDLPSHIGIHISEQGLEITGVPCNKEGLLELIGLVYPISAHDPEGLIDFPVFRVSSSSQWSSYSRSRLQGILLRTWLQHPQSRTARKEQQTRTDQMDDRTEEWTYLPLINFKAILSSVDKWDKAQQKGEAVEIASTLVPGAMIRHNAVKETALTDSVACYPLLLFTMLGCLHFEGTAFTRAGEFDGKTESFVVIPRSPGLAAYVKKLTLYYRFFAEAHLKEAWRATGTSDAALMAAVIIHADEHQLFDRLAQELTIIRFGKVVWSQQRTRTGVYHTSRIASAAIQRYRIVTECLRLDEAEGVMPIRDLVASNLIADRPWFSGFTGYAGEKVWYRISRWKKGMSAVINHGEMWDEDQQRQFVTLMHNAIYNRFGKVKADAVAKRADIQAAYNKTYDHLRIAWSKARTRQEFSHHLMNFLADTRPSQQGLEMNPTDILLGVRNRLDWRELRDLCLLALATNVPKDTKDPSDRIKPDIIDNTIQTSEGGNHQ